MDDEDTSEWTDEQPDRAQFSVADKAFCPATGTLIRPGRPPPGESAKRQVTLRLDLDGDRPLT